MVCLALSRSSRLPFCRSCSRPAWPRVAAARSDSGGDERRRQGHARRATRRRRRPTRRSSPPSRRRPSGKGVGFEQSYGASGDQSRAVDGGLAGRRRRSLARARHDPARRRRPRRRGLERRTSTKGFVTDSVVVFVVRKGNPKGIKTWDDLIKAGVEVITPNPFTSGGAQWNIMAALRRADRAGQDRGARPSSTSSSCSTTSPCRTRAPVRRCRRFVGGKGDVLLAYENEAITAQQKGEDVEYVIPDETILIENPIARDQRTPNPETAKAFVDFAATPRRRRRSSPRRATARSARPGRRRRHLPDARRALHDRRPRRLGRRSTRSSSTRTTAIVAEIDKSLGVSTEYRLARPRPRSIPVPRPRARRLLAAPPLGLGRRRPPT